MKFGHAPSHRFESSRPSHGLNNKRATWSRVGVQHSQRRRLAHQQRCNGGHTGGASPMLATATTPGGYKQRVNSERNSKQLRGGANGNSNLAVTQSPTASREILTRDSYRNRGYSRQQRWDCFSNFSPNKMLDSAGNLSSSRLKPFSSQSPSRPQTANNIGRYPSPVPSERREQSRPESASRSRKGSVRSENIIHSPARLASPTSPTANTPIKELKPDSGDATVMSKTVVIHVMDEVREIQKDFRCDRDVLIKGMSYFAKYISDDTGNEVDISVHVDVTVFEWLMGFITAKSGERPKISIKNVTALLISSQFLQMQELVQLCLQYMKKHMSEVIQTPVNLSCLNAEILQALSELFVDTKDIESLKDPKDKIVSTLFKFKLKEMIETRERLFRCHKCGHLYTAAQHKLLDCNAADPFVSFNGRQLSRHVAEREWTLSRYLLGLRLNRFCWRTIYWKIWSLLQEPFKCMVCCRWFTVGEFAHCSYHPAKPTPKGGNSCIFTCCGLSISVFDTTIPQVSGTESRSDGCKAMDHNVESKDVERWLKLHAQITSHRDLVLVPFKKQVADYKKSKKGKLIRSSMLHRPMTTSRSNTREHESGDKKMLPPHKSRVSASSRGVITDIWDDRLSSLGSPNQGGQRYCGPATVKFQNLSKRRGWFSTKDGARQIYVDHQQEVDFEGDEDEDEPEMTASDLLQSISFFSDSEDDDTISVAKSPTSTGSKHTLSVHRSQRKVRRLKPNKSVRKLRTGSTSVRRRKSSMREPELSPTKKRIRKKDIRSLEADNQMQVLIKELDGQRVD